MGKRGATCIVTLGCLALLTGCGVDYGAPDREETFSVQGGACSARWWLEPLADEVPEDASDVAREALFSSTVSASELGEWKEILLESQSGDRQSPVHTLDGYAYVEAVRADVRSELQDAGYPDASGRVIEVYSDSDCSRSN